MKKSTKLLIIILVALVGIYAGMEYFGGKTRSDNFRSTLVEINAEEVTAMKIIKGAAETSLKRNGEEWIITLASGKEVTAKYSSVEEAISSLESIKPDKMVARKAERWAEYEVDTAGIRVEVFEGNKKTLDIVLGRFGMIGQNKFYTFVRLSADEEVYVANDFISFSIPYETSAYREQELYDLNRDSLVSVTFNYPADSSFSLVKQDSRWTVDGVAADSAGMAGYLGALTYKSSPEFEDVKEESQLGPPTCTVTFKSTDKETVVSAWKSSPWVIKSSENSSLFSDDKLFEDLFKGRGAFLTSDVPIEN